MLKELLNKRNEILGSLKTMYTDLESVNKDIDSEVVKNNATIVELTTQVSELSNLKELNNKSMRNLKKILGE